jgi:hypothetical protein
LYNYLQGQSQYHMMYPQQPERRYWKAMILNSLTLYDFLKLSNLFNSIILHLTDFSIYQSFLHTHFSSIYNSQNYKSSIYRIPSTKTNQCPFTKG